MNNSLPRLTPASSFTKTALTRSRSRGDAGVRLKCSVGGPIQGWVLRYYMSKPTHRGPARPVEGRRRCVSHDAALGHVEIPALEQLLDFLRASAEVYAADSGAGRGLVRAEPRDHAGR